MEQDREYYFTVNFMNIIFIKKRKIWWQIFMSFAEDAFNFVVLFWKKFKKYFYLKSSWVQNQYSQLGWNL